MIFVLWRKNDNATLWLTGTMAWQSNAAFRPLHYLHLCVCPHLHLQDSTVRTLTLQLLGGNCGENGLSGKYLGEATVAITPPTQASPAAHASRRRHAPKRPQPCKTCRTLHRGSGVWCTMYRRAKLTTTPCNHCERLGPLRPPTRPITDQWESGVDRQRVCSRTHGQDLDAPRQPFMPLHCILSACSAPVRWAGSPSSTPLAKRSLWRPALSTCLP